MHWSFSSICILFLCEAFSPVSMGCVLSFCVTAEFVGASGAGCLTLACVFTLICLSCLLSGPVKRVVTDDVNY